MRVFGDGQQRRCFCLVGDTVRAIMRLLETEAAWGQVFNIGSEKEITILELAERVRERAGSDVPIELVPYDVAYGEGFEDMERRQPDTTRIRDVIGWTPEHSLDEIIDATIGHMRATVTA